MNKPHVVILGGNFAGLGSAQKIREYADDSVDITVIDRKNYLLYIPNIPAEVFENKDPAEHLTLDLYPVLKHDDINFIQGDVTGIDVDNHTVAYVPSERPGSATQSLRYDYLVIAVGARLAFDKIEGFAEYGDTVSDFYYGNRLRKKLHDGSYKGGPIVVGSAKFHQGNGADGLEPYPGGSIPRAMAACEGPPVEVALTVANWLQEHGKGDASNVTITTPGKMIAEDAGEKVVGQLLDAASSMGFNYLNNTGDIVRLTADSIEFENGQKVEAELKILFPDWVAHDFLKGLPISDDQGFIITDLLMRNPKYPEIFAAGDCAAVTVPKLGAIGHQECEIIGRQIALDRGLLTVEAANQALQPVVFCIGDMGGGKGFYIRSNAWFGGDTQILKMGRIPYLLKMQYKTLFMTTKGKTPPWGNEVAEFLAEKF
ncbi:FAD-dependent oxidoreductase [Thiothrix litoralis]|uniref:FAD-dependent oxidoreductase n=1 Tax=Thiothrix litoralis TaxID=2891210 RepID=A0ABX7WWQ9_9GAMM|nr:FAD-dependent oxidoreductase [Thiothrix litoralis]QTR47781.1 FAD-dependent oxidoreductase [Thiothrix litoralis]